MMARKIVTSYTLLLVAAVFGIGSLAYADGDLQQQLGALERLRKGAQTPFAEVERQGQRMLKEYPSPEEQGRIFYQLAHTHGQSDIWVRERADRVIEYAQKGLACPLEPARRLHLYSYWADAIRAGDRSRPSPERRKEAATVLLKGLKEAQGYEIPDTRPEGGTVPLLIGPAPSAPSPQYEAARKKAEDIATTQKRNRQQVELWLRRKVLIMQIVDVYRQRPYAASEFRELATKILGDQATIDLLSNRLKEIGAFEDEPRVADAGKAD